VALKSHALLLILVLTKMRCTLLLKNPFRLNFICKYRSVHTVYKLRRNLKLLSMVNDSIDA